MGGSSRKRRVRLLIASGYRGNSLSPLHRADGLRREVVAHATDAGDLGGNAGGDALEQRPVELRHLGGHNVDGVDAPGRCRALGPVRAFRSRASLDKLGGKGTNLVELGRGGHAVALGHTADGDNALVLPLAVRAG